MSSTENIIKQQKEAAAERAVETIRSGMVVGLGSGSTAILAVRRLGALLKKETLRNIVCIPTSTTTEEEAQRLGIPLTTLEAHPRIDVTIDGADEIDPHFNAIKGGGGALLREKIVAQASQREIIIVDESKPSPVLGTTWALPVEVIPFGWGTQKQFLEEMGATVTLRVAQGETEIDGEEYEESRGKNHGTDPQAKPFRTDHGNLILDCDFGTIDDPIALSQRLDARTGIVEHGLFLGLITDVIIASDRGIEHKQK